MKATLYLFLLVIFTAFLSCETDNSSDKEVSYLEYLSDKAIIGIHIQGDTKYILTSRFCNTCDVPPYVSSIPTIQEWTVIVDSSYENFSPAEFSGVPFPDNNGNLYVAHGKTLYKLSENSEKEKLINTGDFSFTSFEFDNENNIWFYGDNNGIAFWNKSEFKVYNTSNSLLPTDYINGLKVDKLGVIWASLGYKGLLKIEDENWNIIPNTDIPGLKAHSYLRGPKIVAENSIWFEVFSSDTTSNILRLENDNWIYEFPENSGNFKLALDSKGTIWACKDHFENGFYEYSTLNFYSNNSWIDFGVSQLNAQIISLNADDIMVYIGTLNGLIEIPR